MRRATVITAPEPLHWPPHQPSLFLAGSIAMGQAEPWQDEVIAALGDLAITLLNPRRPDWDATWRQRIDEPPFREQVEWELEAQERASTILMYFAPTTQAPITLLELGLFARSGKLLVGCPDGFWRKGNVEVVCARWQLPLFPTLPALVAAARQMLEQGAE